MVTTTCTQRRYDHRLKELVRTTQDIECAIRQGVPRSTARGWLTNPGTKVVTIDVVNMDVIRLQREVLLLRRRVRKLTALLRVLLAQTDITFSNSLIESWWRVLKHQWLFLNTLDTVNAVKRLVAFYVREHNARLPHSAFRGQTPDEMYFQTGDSIPEELEAARREARQARAEANRKQDCDACGLLAASLN